MDDTHPGKRSCYTSGCKLPQCCEANTKYQNERRWRLGIHQPKHLRPLPEHGTTARYGNPHKCRCDKCRRANTVDALARRRRRKSQKWFWDTAT